MMSIYITLFFYLSIFFIRDMKTVNTILPIFSKSKMKIKFHKKDSGCLDIYRFLHLFLFLDKKNS